MPATRTRKRAGNRKGEAKGTQITNPRALVRSCGTNANDVAEVLLHSLPTGELVAVSRKRVEYFNPETKLAQSTHPRYRLVRRFLEGSEPYLTLADPALPLQEDEKQVRTGTLASLIEWARPRKDGARLIQRFLNDAVWLQREIFPLTH